MVKLIQNYRRLQQEIKFADKINQAPSFYIASQDAWNNGVFNAPDFLRNISLNADEITDSNNISISVSNNMNTNVSNNINV